MKNTPLNMAQAMASQRSLTSVQTGSGYPTTEAIQLQLDRAADSGQSRLGILNRFHARRHESQESLETSKAVVSFREERIRRLATDAIDAQIALMRAELNHRFNTEYAVIAERGLAAFAQAQNSFFSLIDAGVDQIYEALYLRVQELTDRHKVGRFSDASYENEMVRAQNQAQIQIRHLETACRQRIESLNNAFNDKPTQRNSS